jgi:hypothetical protein
MKLRFRTKAYIAATLLAIGSGEASAAQRVDVSATQYSDAAGTRIESANSVPGTCNVFHRPGPK